MAKFIGIMVRVNPITKTPDQVLEIEREIVADSKKEAEEFLRTKYFDELDFDWLFHFVYAIPYPVIDYGNFESGPSV